MYELQYVRMRFEFKHAGGKQGPDKSGSLASDSFQDFQRLPSIRNAHEGALAIKRLQWNSSSPYFRLICNGRFGASMANCTRRIGRPLHCVIVSIHGSHKRAFQIIIKIIQKIYKYIYLRTITSQSHVHFNPFQICSRFFL